MDAIPDDRPAAPLDFRLATAAACLWASCLLTRLAWISPFGRAWWWAAAAVAGIGMAVAVRAALRRPPSSMRWTLLGVACCCAAGVIVTAGVLHGRASGPLADLAQQQQRVSMEVVLTGDPHLIPPAAGGPGRTPLLLADARTVSVQATGGSFLARQPVLLLGAPRGWAGVLPSQRLRVQGRLGPPRPGDTVAAALTLRGPPVLLSRPSRVQRLAGSLRAGLQEASSPLRQPQRGLLPALVDGDTSMLSPAVATDFKAAGLTHLTAVSGANCAVIVGAVLMIVRRTRLRSAARGLVMVLAIGCFVVIARPSPSVLRAAMMAAVASLSLVCGRPRSALPALAGAVTFLLLTTPDLAGSQGFALSVAATAGLLIVAPRWADRWRQRLPGPLADALAVTLAAQLACTPIIAALSGSVSVVAVPANLLAAPAVPAATVLGALSTLTAPLSMPAARALARPAGGCCWWLIHIAHIAARVPGGRWPWWDGWPGAVAATVVLAAAGGVGGLVRARRRSGLEPTGRT